MRFRLRGKFVFLILFFIFIFFAFQDWPDFWRVAKDIFIAMITLSLFIISRTDEGLSKEEMKQEKIENKADKETLKYFQYLLIIIGISFNILFYFYNNIVIGVISVLSLMYYVLTNLLQISISMYNYKKKS